MILLRVPGFLGNKFFLTDRWAGEIVNSMVDRKWGKQQDAVRVGFTVDIIQKKDQQSGRLTRGRVKEILTRSLTHPHGIKVRLEDGRVGRVAATIDTGTDGNGTAG